MRRRRAAPRRGARGRWLLGTVVPLMMVAMLGGPRVATGQAANDEATHEALRALRRDVEAAFNKVGESGRLEDFEPILKYVDDDVVLAAMNGSLVVGKTGLLEYFKRTMTGPDRTVKSVHHTFEPAALTKLYGDNAGVVYGRSLGRYALSDGTNFDVKTIWTCTLVRRDGRWLIASFQFAPSIFDSPVTQQAVHYVYWGAGIAAVVGLFLGFLFGRITRRGGAPA